MKISLVIFYICYLGVNHCNAQRAFEMENLRRYTPPKNQKFVLAKDTFRLKDTSVVSSNAYYLQTFFRSELRDYKVVDTYSFYVFMRFYSNGRMFCSFSYLSSPSKRDLQDTSYGKFGRYVVKDGTLIVELYQDNYDKYNFMYAYSLSDGIQFYGRIGRGKLAKIFGINKSKDGGYYRKFYF